MQKISFTVEGKPQAKQRPRFANGHAYTPQKTKDYEQLVKLAYREQCGFIKLDGAIKASILVSVKTPKSMLKRNQIDAMEGRLKPTKKPDCDNIIKIILDALNGEAYVDDRLITEVHIAKKYGNSDGVLIELEEI